MIRVFRNRFIRSIAVQSDRIKRYLLSTSTPTPVAYSLQYPGTDEYVSIPNSASLQVTGAQTWAMWCKLEDLASFQVFLGWRNTATDRVKIQIAKRPSNDGTVAYRNQFQFGISQNGGQLGGGNTKNYYSVGLTTNSWCLVGFTFTTNTFKPYFNNSELTVAGGTLNKVTDNTVNSLYNNTVDPIFMGAIGNTPTFFSKGFLDYAVFCNKALSAAEWAELYSKKPGSMPEPSDFSFSANIVSLWKKGETPDVYGGSGGITDSVGTNHGTMQNFDAGSFSTDVAS